MSVDMHVSMHACVPNIHSYLTVHIFHVTEQIWLLNCKYDYTAIRVYKCIDRTILNVYAKTKLAAIFTSHIIAIYEPVTNMLLNVLHMQTTPCAHDTNTSV